jgi:predicted metal-dependent peptidase
MMTPEERLLDKAAELMSKGRFLVREKAKCFRPFLSSVQQIADPEAGTAYCTANGVLGYAPAFIASLDYEEVAGVIAHEFMHLWLKHHERAGGRDAQKWNEAADRSLYAILVAFGFKLPANHLRGADLGMDEGLTADEYYREAEKQQGGASKNGPGQGQPQGAGSGPGPGSGAPRGPGTGSPCGSAAGNPHPNEPAPGDPNGPQGRTEAQLNRSREQAKEELGDMAGKGQGKLPAALERLVGALNKPAKVPWRQKLATAIRSSCAYRPGAVVHRYDSPGRRQAGLGYGDGRPVMPRLRSPVPQVCIGLDTSGSMGGPTLEKALTEADGVLKAVGADVSFMSCDAQVHAQGRVRSVREMARLVKGGGGTDFRPIFEAARKQRPVPEVLIIFTDGMGTAPEAPPPFKTIWALLGEGAASPVSWGMVVEVDPSEDDDE